MNKACLVALLLLPGLLPAAEPAKVSVDDLDSLVGRWMDLRTTIADEKRAWQARKSQWKLEIQLLTTEKQKLQKDMEASNRSASSVEKDRAGTLKRKESLETLRKALQPLLDRSEARLHVWQRVIPDSLSAPLAKGFAALPTTTAQAETQAFSERAQRITALYSQIESLQHGLHTTSELLGTGEGQRRQVNVLYLGLARGFAVSPDLQWAAVGIPTAKGWTWSSRPVLAQAVQMAIDVVNQKETARLVNLPLKANDVDVSNASPDKGVGQ